MYKRLLIVAALVTAISGFTGLTSVSAQHTDNTNEDKITICHRTNAPKNPYRLITVSKNAVDGKGKNDHSHHTGPVVTSLDQARILKAKGEKWGDIIPNGLNWSAEGQAVYNNHCNYPVTEEKTAMIDYDVVCDIANSRAVITLTNTGTASGSATVNGNSITVAANDDEVAYVSTPSGKVQITVVIAGVTVYDEALDCRAAGQGGVKDPVITTPVITPTAPAGQAGQGAVTEPSVASLPYTAGESTQPIALIISAIAAVIAIAGTIIKKAYLKQI